MHNIGLCLQQSSNNKKYSICSQNGTTEPFYPHNMYTKPYVPISLCKKLNHMCYNVYVQISHIYHEIPSG